ncbi:MAG: alcohol dehydrogenase catalytic domain-containing protein [Gemmatimonadetes bacterium]|nr:alcohol dehydrogenase catalytic domain-containing protein [Gemmatimonadota bacterium]
MKAIWLEDGGLKVRDVPAPDPPAGEARVKVRRAGICNTDLELVRGYYPFTGVLGHEFVGVVETGPDELMGRRVVGEINAVCGSCRACREDRKTHCEHRTVLGIVGRHGAFAEYFTLPIDNLHVVPENVSDDHGTFTEPLAAALEIQQQIDVSATDRVLVVGDGKLGQLIARTLALTGCDLTVLGRHAEKLELLASHGTAIDDPDSVGPATFDIAVECTGNADGFATARRALRPRGTLVLKSTYAGDLTFDASALVVDEITLVGSRCGPFAPALELLANGTIDVAPLIHARYPLEDGLNAFEHAAKPSVLKVLLEVE